MTIPLPTSIAEEPSDLERAFRECLNAMSASYRAANDLLNADDEIRFALMMTLGDALDAIIDASESPHGHCDECGGPCDAEGCTTDREHEAAQECPPPGACGLCNGSGVIDDGGAQTTCLSCGGTGVA